MPPTAPSPVRCRIPRGFLLETLAAPMFAALVCGVAAGCMATAGASSPPVQQERPSRLGAAPTVVAEAIDPVQKALELGEQALKLGDLLTAQLFFRQVVEQQPEHPRASYYLAVILEQSGDSEAAKQWYRQALQSDPDLAAAAINLSAVLLDQGHADDAVAVLEEAVAHSPKDPILSINLGSALSRAGNVDGAIEAYRKALTIVEHPETRLAVVVLLAESGHLDESLAELRRIPAVAEDRRDILGTVAFLFEQMGEPGDCVHTLDHAIALEASAELYAQRGSCRERTGDRRGAEADYRAAVGADADFAAGHCMLAQTLRQSGRWQEASTESDWCTALDPEAKPRKK